jgi:hypothetical protein
LGRGDPYTALVTDAIDTPFAEYLAANQAARRANTTPDGRIKNRALDLRLQDAFRAECIRRLGWAPETCAADRYVATASEMASRLLHGAWV